MDLVFLVHTSLYSTQTLVCTLPFRSDGGVHSHSHDEGFPHGFIYVRTLKHHTNMSLVSSTHLLRHQSPVCLPVQALRSDHPQALVLPEEVQNPVTLHLERALVR